SLIAVRLFGRIRERFALDFPISVLFEAPTVAACAELIRAKKTPSATTRGGGTAGHPRHEQIHVVAMQAAPAGGDHPPLFICAGMLGNVLNLRHLARLVGTDRGVYGLQARGLYGDTSPHETFEEMAADYI